MARPKSRVLFVTGKGGTGKSFVARCVAQGAAGDGLAVALLRIGADQREDGAYPLGMRVAAQAGAVTDIALDERTALGEFLHGVVKLSFIAERLMASRTFSALAAAVPGVKDLVTLSAIVDLAARPASRKFDLVVVDAPATGHCVPLVSAPGTVLELATVGPIARVARNAERLVADGKRFRAMIVTNAEEMAVTEAGELAQALAGLGIATSPVVVNGLYPVRLDAEQTGWLEQQRASPDALLHARRAARQRELLRELEARADAVLPIPFLFEDERPDTDAPWYRALCEAASGEPW